MAGLKGVKEKVHALMNFHSLQKRREEAGLPVKRPALHARFLGNPGTGKTTVARLLGQIYKEMGLLSSGHVVLEERKNMIGRYYDSEGQAVDNALNRAKGGILLIDEAYNLYVENDDKDPGRRILEYLLTALADENNRDWMLILAGYPKEMKTMLESNPGIESRVSEIFEFEDLNVEELLQVAELYCDDNKYELSEEARERLKAVITRDVAAKDKNFGNGRYVNKLMETAINTRMASRLSKIVSPTYDQLITIEAEDIPIEAAEAERIVSDGFDDKVIDDALKRLDALVGLSKVKSAIHNFVNISRFLNSKGERIRGKGLLKWNFTGNTGTGKSTIAQILADILKGMNLIQNSELTEIKGEEIFNVSDYECNEVIRGAVKRSRRGVLFIDGDAPEFRSSQYRMTSEQIRFKLATLASEDNASGALIISECSSPNLSIANSLAANGIYDFDHTFIFDDYTADELYDILVLCLEKLKTRMSEEAEAIIRNYIRNLCANRELSFANARTMKNLSRAIFETVILRMSESQTTHEDRIVLAKDVESFVWKKLSNKIGF
jgi:replication-associated recombination protein RarA